MIVSVFVEGEPKTAGSKNAIPLGTWKVINGSKRFLPKTRKSGVPLFNMVDSTGDAGKRWRKAVASRFKEEFERCGASPIEGPVLIRAVFYLSRPKNEFRVNGLLKEWAAIFHTKYPDVTKLLRAVEDALPGIAYVNDSQIVTTIAQKRYADDGRTGASIMLGPLEEFAERALVDLRPPTCYSASHVPERRSEVDEAIAGDRHGDRGRRGNAVRDVPVRP